MTAYSNNQISFVELINPPKKKRAPKGSLRGFHPCKTCGEIYENRTGKKSYCSKACWPTVVHACVYCNNLFNRAKKTDIYCSNVCQKAALIAAAIATREANRDATDTDSFVECRICGQHLKQLAGHTKRVHGLTTEQYKLQFPNAETIGANSAVIYRERLAGENNPWFNHGGTLSPFSKNNAKLKDLSDEDKDTQIKENIQKFIVDATSDDSRPMNVSYWVKRGLTEEEAKAVISKRQSTFSLDKCIARYGDEVGKEKWAARQAKWQATLNTKSEEEIERINQEKMRKSGSISKNSQKLFVEINLPGSRWGIRTEHNLGEMQLKLFDNKRAMLDFTLGKKVIEFYGDYWHANPLKYPGDKLIIGGRQGKLSAATIHANDKVREDRIRELGYELKIVWEHDYNTDKEKVIKECLEFLNS